MFKVGDKVRVVVDGSHQGMIAEVVKVGARDQYNVVFPQHKNLPFAYVGSELESVENSVSDSVRNSVSVSVPAWIESPLGIDVTPVVHASEGARVMTEVKDGRLVITVEWE